MNELVARQSTAARTLDVERAEALRLERDLSERPSPDELVQAAEMMIGSSPSAKPHNPEIYVKTMVAHLSKYPKFVLERIVDPRDGVITLHPFAPAIADVEKFAKPIWNEMSNRLKSKRRAVEQLEPPKQPEISDAERQQISDGLKALVEKLSV